MATPIYLLVLGKGFTEAWSRLSKGEQEELWAKVEDVERRAGSNWLILCDSRWADEGVFDWACSNLPIWMLIDSRSPNWRN